MRIFLLRLLRFLLFKSPPALRLVADIPTFSKNVSN